MRRAGTRAWLLSLTAGAAVCAIVVAAAHVLARPIEEPGRAAAVPQAAPPPTSLTARVPSCADLAAGLDERDQLAQLLMVGVDPADERDAIEVVRDDHVGGIFVGGSDTRLLTGSRLNPVHAASKHPLLVAVDDEGGRVQRVDELDGDLPSAREQAAASTPEQVRALGADRGRKLKDRGVTMNLAPVADLSDAAANTVIGDRSYSPDPAVAARYAGAFAGGLAEAGVFPVLKHFPGHGRAEGDSHKGLVRTPPLAELKAADLLPYAELLPRGAPAVMLGHLDVPGLTGGEAASVSPAAYRLLREDYRFGGVAMTDDLGAMRAITDRYGLPDAVLAALTAGADVALWSGHDAPGPVLDRLQKAKASGELPAARVGEALGRVLHLRTGCH
ncbi:glycoside hydrolase family 3 N-terminal domain-containing protein [Amycolatopsis albispora]|uniref:beta-N-acetylhexosaminidase n=1 Tax=Amycolatopsis albispora TaxID=1804986 RepID=A0A344L4V7_9PSEU|nr:glycoside hydrolase family 3 N-terminal domain-containing protein [Amycolatopsis albispora]AXB43081.1 beta-glucosidase [Amycolatopsis albispora]